MERKEAVSIFLKDVIKAYREDQKQKDILASGKSAASLKEESANDYGKVFGSHYFAYQKIGRKPGGFPPLEAIMQWLKDKKTFRIDDERGPGLRGLAFAIARKIAKKGTDIYLGKREGLSIEDRILEARKDLARNLANIERSKVVDQFKQKLNI